MLKNRVLYSMGLIAAAVMLLWSWVWMAAFIMLVVLLLPLLSWLLTAGMAKGISYGIKCPAVIRRGEELTVVISDRSRQMIPDYEINIEIDPPDGQCGEWCAELMNGEKRAIKLEAEHCGEIRCRVVSAYAYDYLGLFRFRLEPQRDAVTVVMPIPAQPDPVPALSQVQYTSYRPKYGGGFSEVHDMREYRPGDSMRDVHWKLSAKTDRLIVREPQVPEKGIVLLTLDICPPSDSYDRTVDRLAWLSRWLCQHETPHEVRWISPDTREVTGCAVTDSDSMRNMLRTLLSERVSHPLAGIESIHFENVDWRYHVVGEVPQ